MLFPRRLILTALLALACAAAPAVAQRSPGERAVIDGPAHDGVEVTCDLPVSEHLKNKGGRDGAGLCVFTSIDHSARWANCAALIGFRDFMTKYPGGGYPEKVARMIPLAAKAKGLPAPGFVQYSGKDASLLDLAIKTGRMPGVTYGYGERYGQRIAHMVSLLHLDEKTACILDNNFPGTYEWMSRGEFLRRWMMDPQSGRPSGGWCVVLLAPPPPPVPYRAASLKESNMLSAFLLTAALAPAQWGGGRCGPVGPLVSPPPMVAPMPRLAPPAPATRPPQVRKTQAPAVKNFGLDWHPKSSEPERYELNRDGKASKVNRRQAFQALIGDGLPDDSGMYHLTVVGSEAACAKVRQDIATDPALARVREKCQIHCHRPDDWQVTVFNLDKLRDKSDPAVFVQQPATKGRGKVILSGPYEGPQKMVSALRKADPSFDPNPPGPAPQPGPAPAPQPHPFTLDDVPAWVWIAGATFLFLWWRKKK